jgi:hypothetical protein
MVECGLHYKLYAINRSKAEREPFGTVCYRDILYTPRLVSETITTILWCNIPLLFLCIHLGSYKGSG